MPSSLTWLSVPWRELTAGQLHAILQLRSRVFVVEQQCVFLEIDGRDPEATHLLGMVDEALPVEAPHDPGAGPPSAAALAHGDAYLAGYARLFAPGVRYPDASCIGRVVTHPAVRGGGVGRALMLHAIASCERAWPGVPIGLDAQQYLERFYQGLGFRTTGATYLEDGIPHVPMRRP